MNIKAEKIELIKLIADVDSENILKKVRSVLTKESTRSSYNPEFVAKMKRSEEDIKAGRTTKIEPADIWNLG